MRTPVFRHRGGFALTLELLLGMVVLLLSILALFTLFPSADKAIVNADHRTQALSLARQLMEQQMATPYASLPLGTSNGTQILNHTQRRGAKPDHEYLYAVDVSQPDPSKDVKKVVVQVKWSRQERNSEVTLVSSKGRMC